MLAGSLQKLAIYNCPICEKKLILNELEYHCHANETHKCLVVINNTMLGVHEDLVLSLSLIPPESKYKINIWVNPVSIIEISKNLSKEDDILSSDDSIYLNIDFTSFEIKDYAEADIITLLAFN